MSSSHNALLLRVELKDFKPAIYREVLVVPNITLRALHAVIQAAMGWERQPMVGIPEQRDRSFRSIVTDDSGRT